jgi:hypothetical protein
VRPFLAVAAALSLAFAPVSADAAPKKRPAKKAKVVCFKKRGKRVCRPKRKPAPKRKVAAPKAAPVVAAPAPAAPFVVATAAPATTETTTTTTTTVTTVVKPNCGTSPWVGYTAEDVNGVFKFTGGRTCVPGPNVLFQLNNRDAQDHNLWAEGISPAAPKRAIFGIVAPDATIEGQAHLPAGEWRLYCDIEGHGSMTRTLTVTG